MARHIPRIYIENFDADEFELTLAQCLHLSVLRKNVGDIFFGFNLKHGEFECLIIKLKKSQIVAKKTHLRRLPQKTKKLSLAFGLLHQDEMKFVVEKATELGVSDIYPIVSAYSFHSMKKDKLEKVITGAVEQSERFDLPVLHDEVELCEFLEEIASSDEETIWISALERKQGIAPIGELDMSKKNHGFVIGPAGGFSEAEKIQLMSKTVPVSLSSNILRAETASIFCLSVYASKHIDYFAK